MRKIVFLLMLAHCFSLSAKPRDCIIIYFKQGDNAVFPIDGDVRITFEDGVMAVLSGRYQISNIKKYVFGDSETMGIDNIHISGNSVSYSNDGRFIHVKTSGTDTLIRLYSVNGTAVPFEAKHETNNVQTIDLSRLQTGVYLLNVGNETIKIKKK